MRITADTNVLLRAAVGDDPAEAKLAINLLRESAVVVIPLVVLCEFVWVLACRYKRSHREIVSAIETLLAGATVSVDRPAVDAGLAVLRAGGDFADGVIAFDGARLGGEVFATFDRDAAMLIGATGGAVHVLSKPRRGH